MGELQSRDQDKNFRSEDNLVVIGSFRTARQAHEAGLSVLAAGRHYWVDFSETGFQLIVEKRYEQQLRREVEIASVLNRYWPPRSLDLPTRSISKFPTFFALATLILFFIAQSLDPALTESGVNNSQSVLQGAEWWRIVTATTLHADIGHLAGNLLGLSLFAYLSCRYMGNGLAWFLTLLAAVCANITSVAFNANQAYQSLGASTAVFAALGLLTGFPFGSFWRAREPLQTRDWMIPFFGGCVLFAWMGGGTFPTDVAAHLWSFCFGLIFSTFTARINLHAKLSPFHQRSLLAFTAAVVIVSWFFALS